MAYMTKDGLGPYPNKAGEYCGNHNPKYSQGGEVHWTIRCGRPRPCKAGTTEELEADGWMGLYLKDDSPYSNPGDADVPTPPELLEPE